MSDIRGTISSVAKSVTKTSGDLLKTTKLNMSLSAEEGKIKALHLEMGRKVQEIYQYGGSLGVYFDGKYEEILAVEKRIAELKEKIAAIKGIRKCPNCEKISEIESGFCPKCGLKFEAGSQEPPEQAQAPPETAPPMSPTAPTQPFPKEWADTPASHAPPPAPALPTKTCRLCKTENDASTKFCLSCGRIID